MVHPWIARVMRRSRTELVGAGACAALVISAAVTLPMLAAADAGESLPTVTPADLAWWAVVALALLQSGALLWVKRSPRLVLLGLALIPFVHSAVIPGGTISLTTVAVSFGVFWAVVREPLAKLRWELPGVVMLVAVCQALDDLKSGVGPDAFTLMLAVLQGLAVVGIPFVAGLFFAARHDARVSRRNEVAALERERDAVVQAAVAMERIAMSRELHDIAAHHMSGIALLASAIYRQIDLDPEAAKRAARQVRVQSTSVLDDLRRVIGLLREDSLGSRSVETLASVHELVDHRRSTGTPVEFVVRAGDRDLGAGVGPLAQLVAFRMVQESLANVTVHAPGANCVVEIDDRHPKHVTVGVDNDGSHAPDSGPGSGLGLVGMRERADLVGGRLTHGPQGDGGWSVTLTLFRDEIMTDMSESPA